MVWLLDVAVHFTVQECDKFDLGFRMLVGAGGVLVSGVNVSVQTELREIV